MTPDERIEKMEGQLARVRLVNYCLIACIVLFFGVWFILKTFDPETPWAQYEGKGRRANSFVRGLGAVDQVYIAHDGIVIRANSFILEDENGNVRASLGMTSDGPGLSLYDENGKVRAGMVSTEDGAKLVLSDENGNVRASLEAGPVPWLKLMNEDFYPHASLMVFRNNPWLTLCDENKKEIWSAP
jgi:hypothetical protein